MPVFRICGQIYHNIVDLHPTGQQARRLAQLYIIDNNLANQTRLSALGNQSGAMGILRQLDSLLRQCNPYAQAYKMMYEVELEEQNRHPDQNIEIEMCLTRSDQSHKNNSSFKACNEVAVVYVSALGETIPERDFCIYSKSEQPRSMSIISKHVDPMTYPLMFPAGDRGWSPNIENLSTITAAQPTILQYYCYRLQNRGEFNPCINLGSLTQQYIVDAFTKVEASRAIYIRTHQAKLRTDLYRGLMDHLANKAVNLNVSVGKPVILPSSFIGSPRALQQNFMDSMTMVQHLGKPDLFITMTCNPKWSEISDYLNSFETALDRPDLVSRVFHEKVKVLKREIIEKQVLGTVIGCISVIEFQKRGLPHVHMLVYLHPNYKIRNADEVDRIISAEIPDSTRCPNLYAMVKQHMIHGPCGAANLSSPCMNVENQSCTKQFPKPFRELTNYNDRFGYPLYRRRNNGHEIWYKNHSKSKVAHNGFVVPYNPYLLMTLNCHINVEICCTIQCVKYLYKYIQKGPDTAVIKFTNSATVSAADESTPPISAELKHDEVTQYLSTRYICPPEAIYRLFEYKIHEQSHAVYRLAVHLDGEQNVVFREGEESSIGDNNVGTTLTAWFDLNRDDPTARHLLYTELSQDYTFNKRAKTWTRRKRTTKPILNRMFFVNPKDSEKYYLRLLLMHVRGAKSFSDLRTVDGILYSTYCEAAVARNLVTIDREWDGCLEEAAEFQFPHAMCQLYANILVFHAPTNARELYDKYKEHFVDTRLSSDLAEHQALSLISKILQSHSINVVQFNLPVITEVNTIDSDPPSVVDDNIIREPVHLDTLTRNQRVIYNEIMEAVTHADTTQRLFFIDGPGGSGKSYLHNTLIQMLETENYAVVVVAWTGIAANLLIRGRTVHTTFKLTLQLTENTVCNITANSPYGRYLASIRLLIWDEISMASKLAVEAVDRLFRDLCHSDVPFGGKVVVVSGDFRQILPVIRHGTRTDILDACVKKSQLWPLFRHLPLRGNMRVQDDDANFKSWLLQVGEGTNSQRLPGQSSEMLCIPPELICSGDIVTAIFGDHPDFEDPSMRSKIILTPTNADVLTLNNRIHELMVGTGQEIFSVDQVLTVDGETSTDIPIEYVHSLTPNGLPPHRLLLKLGSIVILLRNLNIEGGLCNGTRLIIRAIRPFVLSAEILTGSHKGKVVFLPRVDLSPSLDEIPFHMVRRQFPVRLGYAMTINKAQGQSFNEVGLYLPSPVFSHGQLYVALSRVTRKRGLKIKLGPNALFTFNDNALMNHKRPSRSSVSTSKTVLGQVFTPNVVYKEIFGSLL